MVVCALVIETQKDTEEYAELYEGILPDLKILKMPEIRLEDLTFPLSTESRGNRSRDVLFTWIRLKEDERHSRTW